MTKPILVFGDVMFDFFFDLEPKPDSHGVKVYAIPDQDVVARTLGGAANVAKTLAAMGEAAKLLVLCGDKEEMTHMASYLKNEMLHVVPSGKRWEIPYKFWHRLDGKIVDRHDVDGKRFMSARREQWIVKLIGPFLRRHEFSAIVLSDYIKGTLTPKICSEIIKTARELSTPVLVDTKRRDLKRFEGASSIQVSDGFDRHVNFPIGTMGIETLAEGGANVLYRPEMFFPALSKSPINLIGAGDAFMAGFAKSIANGGTWGDAAQWGSYAAKLRVETAPDQEIEFVKDFEISARHE